MAGDRVAGDSWLVLAGYRPSRTVKLCGLGSVWSEDPRYFRSQGEGFRPRVDYVVKTAFLAPHRDGRWHPACARFAANVGNNFLSNTWRADSEANTSDALARCVWGIQRIGCRLWWLPAERPPGAEARIFLHCGRPGESRVLPGPPRRPVVRTCHSADGSFEILVIGAGLIAMGRASRLSI
jgi:hypothetical protein